MGFPRGRAIAIVALILMVGASNVVVLEPAPVGEMGDRANVKPLSDGEPFWSDTLDDTSHVYVPAGGLVGVEVTGGEARLKAGATEGWLASEVIECPPGYDFDLVFLEAFEPGGSNVLVSILNASRESSEIGFANETIPGFRKLQGTDISISSVSSKMYPKIRIQVDLVSSGTFWPRLLAWSLYFVHFEEWRDEFIATGKMKGFSGINVTGGHAELNLTQRGIANKFDPYPPLMVLRGGGSTDFDVFYPNIDRTGYKDLTKMACQGTTDIAYDDLNGDGLLDLVCANSRVSSTDVDSQIYWGTGTEEWSTIDAVDLHTFHAHRVAIGDFNGDLASDLVFACHGTNVESSVFFNKGNGDFNYEPDIGFMGTNAINVDTGDLNRDGYDDIVLVEYDTGNAYCYFGGPSGPDTSADVTFSLGQSWDVMVKDIDRDGHLDVTFATSDNNHTKIFLGSPNGPDATADYSLTLPGNVCYSCAGGDLNGDGFMDLIFTSWGPSPVGYRGLVFEGSAHGWNTTSSYEFESGRETFLRSIDLNQDGYDDVLACFYYEDVVKIYFGGTSPFYDADIIKDVVNPHNLDVAVPRTEYHNGSFGKFITEAITLPQGKKWDILNIEGESPQNTSITLSVLDNSMKKISGYEKLTAWNVDLSGIDSHPTIHIVVVMQSEFNNTTPTLDHLMVKWMDRMTWREEFYGMAKIDACTGLEVRDGELRRAQETGGPADGSYLSKAFGPDVARDAGSFHTLRYTARLGSSQSGKLRLVDASTSEVLAETQLQSGDQEWNLEGAFSLKDHPLTQINVTAEGLDVPGEFALDDLWVNWTKRVKLPPRVVSLTVSEPSVYRLQTVTMSIEVADEYDLPGELLLKVEHRLSGTTTWFKYLLEAPIYNETAGVWVYQITPKVGAMTGVYDLRVDVTDTDMLYVDNVEFPALLEVLNNRPTKPVVHIMPTEPSTSSQLRVEFDNPSTDLESAGLEYRYRWYRDGEPMTDITRDIVSPSWTAKGQNWSVEVRAFDGDDESGPALAWVLIGNAAPVVDLDLPDPDMDEDTSDSDWLDLSTAFKDPDGDPLTWSLAETVDHLEVTIDPATGKVTLSPEQDWYGQVDLTFVASDGEATATQTVTVTVNPINDLPVITTVDGKPVTSDPMVYSIRQGDRLVITYDVTDVEGNTIRASVNTSAVTFDETQRTITFEPGNDAVGTLRFAFWISDDPANPKQVTLNFVIVVENVNDPMGDPVISKPGSGEEIKVNQSFSLIAVCDDPDLKHGQVLNFTWESNVSGVLGYGASLTARISEPGHHRITVTVRDPDFTKSAFVDVYIKPEGGVEPPPEDGEEESGVNWMLIAGIVVALVIVVAVLSLVGSKRRAERIEAEEEAAFDAEVKRGALERARDAPKETADEREAEIRGEDTPEGIEVTGAPATALSMQAAVTAGPSEEVAKLFAGVPEAEAVQSEEEREALRLDNLKRKYQNAIGRLPYGVPSKELQGMDWVELASALATGEKKTVEGGREVTEIDGRWYYSDIKDTGTFLKEHGAKKEERPAAKKAVEPSTDKDALLAKLEERFILGEISEKAYHELKGKLGG